MVKDENAGDPVEASAKADHIPWPEEDDTGSPSRADGEESDGEDTQVQLGANAFSIGAMIGGHN